MRGVEHFAREIASFFDDIHGVPSEAQVADLEHFIRGKSGYERRELRRVLQLQVLGRLRRDRVRSVWSAFYSVYGWVDPVEAIERTIADLLRAIRGWRVDPTVQDVLDLQARVDVAKHGYDMCALMFSLERRMEQADLGHRWAVVKEGLDLLKTAEARGHLRKTAEDCGSAGTSAEDC